MSPPPIEAVAERLGVTGDAIEPMGEGVAKLRLPWHPEPGSALDGRLVLVTAITPTRHGEGKTVTAIGLADALAAAGQDVALALREPSLGPLMGLKGGATGGGRARVEPSERIDLHFTGDLHAVTAANNLLVALADAHRYHGNALEIDARAPALPRCLDVDDRQLRHLVTGLGGPTGGVPREDGFVITAASETMGVLAVADGLRDLRTRLDRLIVARNGEGAPVTAGDLGGAGAAAALLRDAARVNLVATAAGTPALVHAGPFANLGTGHNSVLADRVGLANADLVVAEVGFGAELGLEKYVHLVGPRVGAQPSLGVVVATVRAVREQGGGDLDAGLANLDAHLDVLDAFGVPAVVAVNRFPDDTGDEVQRLLAHARERGVPAVEHTAFRDGPPGAKRLAETAIATLERERPEVAPLYDGGLDPRAKIERIAQRVYGSAGVRFEREAGDGLAWAAEHGYGDLPVCMAKTALSLSDDPSLKGRPEGFELVVREVEVHAGAGYLLALTGHQVRMPGLGRQPAARDVDLGPDGSIVGLGPGPVSEA